MQIQHVIHALSKVCPAITLVSNHKAHHQFGLEVIPDYHQQIGPMGGIMAGLRHSQSAVNLFVACDMPFISNEVLTALLKKSTADGCITAAYGGRRETLCTIYPKSALEIMEAMVKAQQFRLYDLLDELHAEVVDVTHLCSGNPFININTPDALK